MTHPVGTREQWLKARLELLQAEKELTRRSDELAQRRQALPWVRVEQDYSFDAEPGKVSLMELFRGRTQLLVYHFMFGPTWTQGCPSCSAIADGFEGITVHLEHHDVAFAAVSRAPLAKLLRFRERMGWSFPWVSSADGKFNFDFNVSFTEEEQRARYHRVQLRPRVPRDGRGARPESHRYRHCQGRGHGCRNLRPRPSRHERFHPTGWRDLSHLFRLRARAGPGLEHVPVAGSCAAGPQRAGHLVEAPRRVRRRPRQGGCLSASQKHDPRLLGVAVLAFIASTATTVAWCKSMSAMPGMDMPGGWTMTMTFMRTPGQTWVESGGTFVAMWDRHDGGDDAAGFRARAASFAARSVAPPNRARLQLRGRLLRRMGLGRSDSVSIWGRLQCTGPCAARCCRKSPPYWAALS